MKALNAPGAGDRITGMLTGQITDLLSRASPVAGMLLGMVAGTARGHGRDDEAVAEQAASDAETKFRREQMARPKLRRIAIWDRWLRVDDLDDGSAVIYKPDVGEYLVLDTRQKTWVRLAAAPVDADMQRIGADPQRCRYAVQRDIERIGTRTLDGRDAEGYRSTERMPYDQGVIMVSEDISWISGQRIPPDILEVMHGFPNCPPDSPAARSQTVPDDRVTPYQAVLARFEDAAGRPVPPPAGSDNTADMVYFEQHLRTLAHSDRDVLFSAPADYRQLQ